MSFFDARTVPGGAIARAWLGLMILLASLLRIALG